MTMTDNRSPAQSALDLLLTGLRDQASPDELETWRNATRGSIVLRRFSESGHMIEVLLRGGQAVQLSPRERRINAEAAASAKLNPFANGTMQPIRLIESEHDTAELAASPNVMSESGVLELFGAHWKQFQARIEQVDNPLLLHRMLEVADSAQVNATLNQVKTIKARLAKLDGETGAAVDEVSTSSRPVDERRSRTE